MAFTLYTDSVSIPSTIELVASLTGPQRSGILNGFADGKSPVDIKIQYGIPRRVVSYFFNRLKSIEITASNYMKENNPPIDKNSLISLVSNDFSVEFTTNQITSIINKMIEYSRLTDGSFNGDWDWYSSKIIE